MKPVRQNQPWEHHPCNAKPPLSAPILSRNPARAPALAGRLHKPCFSGKAAKNSQGGCATGCRLLLPDLFYIAAALGLSPRPRTVPGTSAGDSGGPRLGCHEPAPQLGWGHRRCPVLFPLPSEPRSSLGACPAPVGHHSPTHTKSCSGGSLTRRMEVVSVSLSLVRGFAL